MCFACITRYYRDHTCCTRRGRAWPFLPFATLRASTSPSRPWPSGLSAPFGYASHRPPAPAGPRLQKARSCAEASPPVGGALPRTCHAIAMATAERYLPPDPPLPEKETCGSLLPADAEPFSLPPCVDPASLHQDRSVQNTSVHTEPSATCSQPRLALRSPFQMDRPSGTLEMNHYPPVDGDASVTECASRPTFRKRRRLPGTVLRSGAGPARPQHPGRSAERPPQLPHCAAQKPLRSSAAPCARPALSLSKRFARPLFPPAVSSILDRRRNPYETER